MIKILKGKDAYRPTLLNPVFNSVDDIGELKEVLLKQDRAKKSIDLGLSVNQYGYNIYLSGENCSRKKVYLETVLKKYAKSKEIPNDLCYINNFDDESKPILLSFKAGDGFTFKEDIENLAKEIKEDLTSLFSSNEYKKDMEMLELKYENLSYDLFDEYKDKILEYGFALSNTNGTLSLLMCNPKGKILSDKKAMDFIYKYEELFKDNKNNANILLVEMYHKDSQMQKDKSKEIEEFNKNKALEYIKPKLSIIKENYSNSDNANKIDNYLNQVENYIIKELNLFQETNTQNPPVEISGLVIGQDNKDIFKDFFNKLSVNLIVDNKDLKEAPIIFVDEINELDLLGGVVFEMDKTTSITRTDFKQIRVGDLVKANGGYLVVNAKDLFLSELWDDFKQVLKTKQIKFTSKYSTSIILNDAIESEPIDIDLKVIFVGNLDLYYNLLSYDEDFMELFKIHSKFEKRIDRNEDNELLYAKLLIKFCSELNLKPLTIDAINRVIEYSSKLTGSQSKLSLIYRDIYKLLIEADTLSSLDKKNVTDITYIEKALIEQVERVDSVSKYFDEKIKNNTFILNVEGSKVGEVNALAVSDYYDFNLGNVIKVTANTYKSKEYGVISVDRDADLTGPIYDKAIGNITGFLGQTFAIDNPISLAINVSFEQAYGGIDGDSATLAKTCAILSDISGIPIKQSIGITGSMNQKGDAQSIGGVNEKIEGFYNLCKTKNKLKDIGVIIPKSNISDLMLKKEVVDAINKGEFTIYAIDTINDAVEVLLDKKYEDIIDICKENLNNCKNINLMKMSRKITRK